MSDTEITRFQCRHILANGHRCASPSLRSEHFCYYHHTTRRPVQNLPERRARQATFALPNPEDRSAIQSAIGEILRRIAMNQLDTKRAGLLLYGLQIASLNLPKNPPATHPVEDITLDETHGPIAPIAEYQSEPHEKTLEEILTEQWEKDEKLKAEKLAEQALSNPFTIPSLDAATEADDHSTRRPTRPSCLSSSKGTCFCTRLCPCTCLSCLSSSQGTCFCHCPCTCPSCLSSSQGTCFCLCPCTCLSCLSSSQRTCFCHCPCTCPSCLSSSKRTRFCLCIPDCPTQTPA